MAFKIEQMDEILVINMPMQFTRPEAEAFEVEAKSWLLLPQAIHVLNFADLKKVDYRYYRMFVLFNKSLRGVNKYLYSVNINSEILGQIKKDGLNDVLMPFENLEAIRARHGKAKKTPIDVGIINTFLECTEKTLETQAGTKIKAGAPYLKEGSDPFPIQIAGLIKLESPNKFNGNIAVCFQASTFLKIYSKMVGEEATEITDEIQDGAGELINIIYGQAKTILNEKGYDLGMALPTVLVGEKLKIRHQSREKSMVIPFESEAGPMFVEIIIEKK